MSAKRILLIDDDEDLRSTLAEQLEMNDDYETIQVGTGGEALTASKADSFDLILMDVGLPDFDGREVCRLLRKNGTTAPVIMLTGADTDADTILGLESGANDYVTKPFKFSVLLARIRAHLRQHEHSEDAVFSVGPFSFKPAAKTLVRERDGQSIRLTEKETAILRYLLKSADKAVPREELLNEVWGYNAGVTTHTLETHVYRLRQKIEDNPSRAQLLQTEPGGYRLNSR